MRHLLALLSLSFYLVFVAANAFALDLGASVEVAADQLELRQKQGRAVFKQNVRVTHGELKLTADALEVYYKGGKNGEMSGDIQRLVASGNVYAMLPKGETLTADNATYTPGEQTLKLTGNVALVRGENVLSGDALVYDLAEGTAALTASSSTRVKAKFVANGS
jgi:lipopolysaccharide export system protein LptA